jgi:REP element-mobilizing transposase RayT
MGVFERWIPYPPKERNVSMRYNQNIHHRKSIRIKGYDYSKEGLYFITICTQNREYILSEIVGADSISAQIKLNNVGNMINNIYLDLQKQFINIQIHDYFIMPNHIHGIIEICRADMESAPTINQMFRYLKIYGMK